MKIKKVTAICFLTVFAICLLGGVSVFAFSDEYEPYYPHITAVTRSVDDIYARISGSQVELPEETVKARREMIQMYKDVGIDVSLDMENWIGSYRMISDFPQRWSDETPKPLGSNADYAGAFSIDACWNNKIPEDAPRTLIPRSALTYDMHIGVVKANVDDGGYGTGIPQLVSTPSDPQFTVASKYRTGNLGELFIFRIREDMLDYVNNGQNGDEHSILIDGETLTALQIWKTRVPGDPRGYGLDTNRLPGYDIRTSAAKLEYSLKGIGAEGQCGVNAANCVTNAYTIKSSEISSTTEMINHALGGAIAQMVTARVFPAVSTDAAMGMHGTNEGSNYEINLGVVPYGGIIQVDPEIDLDALYNGGKLSFHGYRILKCMQEYGFYNIDCSGGSFFFYTNTYSKDWINPDFRGFDVPYKNGEQGFPHVTDELRAFFAGDDFFGIGEPNIYVTVPVVKYADLDVNDDGVIDQTDHDLVAENVGAAYTDANKQYDVNQDKEISVADIEIMYNYLNNLPMHTFTWHDVAIADNDAEHGRVIVTGPSKMENGVEKFKDGMIVSIGAAPINGYEFAGWTGDLEGYDTQVVKMIMDKDITVGAKYRKLPEMDFSAKVSGPGHIEVSETAVSYDEPKSVYGENTLVSIKAVPDEGYSFLGWAGDVTGYTNPIDFVVTEDTEIIALFGEVGYAEEFKADEWKLASGSETAYEFKEGTSIRLKDWSQSNQIVINSNADKKIDLSGDFTLRAKFAHGSSIGDGNRGKLVFNYKNDKNYYYITVGGQGKIIMGKLYNGVQSQLGEHKGELVVNGITFNKLPLTVEVQRSGSYIYVNGYKDNEKIQYLKIRDKSHKGGTYGVGTEYDGTLTVSEMVVTTANLDSSKATEQTWVNKGENYPWREKLKGAVILAAESNNAYVNNEKLNVSNDGAIKPYYADDGETVYVPLRFVVEKLGGNVAYDVVTDSINVTLGNHTADFKAWTNGAQEVNGTLYVPAKTLAEALGKELYQYKAVVFFSDTVNIYAPESEPECVDFIKTCLDIQYYM